LCNLRRTTCIYTLSLHDALPIWRLPICNDWLEPALELGGNGSAPRRHLLNIFRALEPRLHWHRRSGSLSAGRTFYEGHANAMLRSEEHTSELQSREKLVCRLLLE